MSGTSRRTDAVVIVESGELWSVPLKPGTSGEARIRRTDVDFPSDGTVKWRVTTAEPGKLRIDAEVSYGYPMTSASHRGKALGKWVATYGANDVLPESFTANINGPPGADSRGYNTNTVTGRMTFDVQ